MSHSNSSLALEIKEEATEPELNLFVRAKHLSLSDGSTDAEQFVKIVKVSGNITVSF